MPNGGGVMAYLLKIQDRELLHVSPPPPFRVLLTDPHLKGGGQVRYVGNLARELVRLGHAPYIGCRRGSVLVDVAAAAGCPALDEFAFRGGLRPASWRHDLRAMRRVISELQPHIVHASGSQDHWVAALAQRSLGFPATLVRTRHNTYRVSDNLANRILNRRWTDYQIVVCDTVRRDLARQRAFDPERMCSIHNGVDAQAFAPDARARASARDEFGYAGSDIVCGIAARLVPAKGHVFLFQAAARLKENHPDLRVLVLGQGDDEDHLKRLASDLGLTAITRFAGFRDDMARCVQAFDIGVQPSIDCDTSSFSLKEQMAAEKPVVASDYGGLTEIVEDGVEGFVAPAGTVEPLTGAIERLVLDAHLRRAMGARGRARVLREFTVEIFARRTVEAYARAWALCHGRRAA
jgi:glycosyltransferase involved in cell wall biosynthesis